MSDFDEHFRFRTDLTERLVLDLFGPAGGTEEILTDEPVNTYLTGVLFPQRGAEDAAEDAAEADIDVAGARLDTDEQPDIGVSMANVQSPSTMGLTFAVDRRCGSLTISVEAAVYEPVDEAGNPVEAEVENARSTDESPIRWRRRAVDAAPVTIDLTLPGRRTHPLVPGLEIRALVREPDQTRGNLTVTVTLVNVHTVQGSFLRDPWCFFQCGLTVTSDSDKPAIVEQLAPSVGDDDETLVSAMLYRHAPTFATGHGCAAEWSEPTTRGASDSRRAVARVCSSFTPIFDVRLSESNTEIDVSGLRMIDLAEGDTDQVLRTIRKLTDGYRRWVEDREAEAAGMSTSPYAEVALDQARECRTTYRRMAAGVDLLARDPEVMRAFKLANRAMATQRARTVMMRDKTSDVDLGIGRWYPFQLGFILLCLKGIADSDDEDRQIADLLWFPTGGGKTEAYLGLVAFTVFLRRIRRRELGGGVTVLMRYTLRLLTLQQFERAATLICAMERVRQDQRDLPGEEISIGMWVGSSATPNKLKDAEASLKKLRAGETLQDNNPVQLRRCPWCGIPIDEFKYRVDLGAQRLVAACGNADCEFRDGLPVHLVDESVYQHRPTLIIATVDKFAQMTWKADPAALFNRRNAPDGTPPPELIIQDELHLISGPLGTLVGLYEAAIDIAANRPKVVASTATIRRAREQGKALFDRDVHQFPPSGLDARDSWFAVEAPPERKPSRRYVGLFAPGTSQATLLVRAYAALLHHAAIIDGKDDVRDAYWTLIGYFNSLRLLAAAELQVNDDVAGRLKLLAGDGNLREVETTELTSRVAASDIPSRLRQLDVRHPDNYALDVVLATNMISVGVDVDRLGLMTVTGQPQTTAEYIQATSRVGRRYPGLVVMLYNAARSRDRSHYENFRAYHSALYRQVESTSVTPFSARARDRALHAALIGAARLTIPDAREDDGAGRLDDFMPELQDLATRILDRVKRIAPDELDSTEKDLDDIISDWTGLVDWNSDLLYHKPKWAGDTKRRPDSAALLRTFEDDDLPHSFPTMNSLRDVDVETNLLNREGR
ncbi:helicase-related protein [Micromonospora sp. 4G55]|uniref:helicase-related protein n=1 Tax=Micromonospora sp. 4G55 TaxID=2806102 RepID=UPI001A5E2B5D|nr:helicase-related protein [Micromonospora sp. 4G55]MBM0255497.1 helicase [Micromonospora sp. 4G55]